MKRLITSAVVLAVLAAVLVSGVAWTEQEERFLGSLLTKEQRAEVERIQASEEPVAFLLRVARERLAEEESGVAVVTPVEVQGLDSVTGAVVADVEGVVVGEEVKGEDRVVESVGEVVREDVS